MKKFGKEKNIERFICLGCGKDTKVKRRWRRSYEKLLCTRGCKKKNKHNGKHIAPLVIGKNGKTLLGKRYPTMPEDPVLRAKVERIIAAREALKKVPVRSVKLIKTLKPAIPKTIIRRKVIEAEAT